MTAGVHIVLGITAFVYILRRAVPNDMCVTTVFQAVNTNYTFYYQPGNDTCCCTLSLTNLNTNLSMSSNVSYFYFVTPSGEPAQSVQNFTNLRLVNNSRVCATPTLDTTMTGVWNIHGDTGFDVRCINNSVVISTTAQVQGTTETQSTRDSEETSSPETTGSTSLNEGTTTTAPPPSMSTRRTKEHESMTTIPMNGEDGNERQVLWISIGSVAGGLIIITGIIMMRLCITKTITNKIRKTHPSR